MLIDAQKLEIKLQADKGDPVALYKMFELLHFGDGVSQDAEKAKEYLITLANLGPYYCALALSQELNPLQLNDYSGRLIGAYEHILSLIAAGYNEKCEHCKAASWYRKIFDLVDIEFYHWTANEREQLKQSMPSYQAYWGLNGFENMSQYLDEEEYKSFKLDWEVRSGMMPLVESFISSHIGSMTPANQHFLPPKN